MMNVFQLLFLIRKKLCKPQSFVFQNQRYEYFSHPYNTTELNERTVEVPIISRLLQENIGKQILEVGNVLAHYGFTGHDVIDKYEKAKNVKNVDVISYSPKKKYDLIVSISTMEHVGWDELPRDKTKIPKALKHLKTLLKPKGKIVFTVPVDINDYLDDMLHQRKLPINDMRCLLRVSDLNIWEERSWEEIKHAQYGRPYRNANAIVIATIDKI